MRVPAILRIFKDGQLIEVKQFDLDQIVIGHDAEVNIELPHAEVSNIHCLIELRDSGYYLCDLGSATGTFKNGTSILDEPLSSGDEIKVGPYKIVFFAGVPKPVTIASEPQIKEVDKKVVKADVLKDERIFSEQPNISTAKTKISVVRDPAPKKSHKTFAPDDLIKDMRKFMTPNKGTLVEVTVVWGNRIYQNKHFKPSKRKIIVGSSDGSDILLPSTMGRVSQVVINLDLGTQVLLSNETNISVYTSHLDWSFDDLVKAGRVQSTGQAKAVRLEQGEMACVDLDTNNFKIFITHIPDQGTPPALGLLDLSAGQLTGTILSIVLVFLLSLWVSINTPEVVPVDPLENLRKATFIYKKPETPPEAIVKPKEVSIPAPEKVKVEASKELNVKGQNIAPKGKLNEKAGRAAELKAKDGKKEKGMQSQKAGGSVKTANQEGAGAKSKDLSKVGLFGAFGGGGINNKLNNAYSGAGEILGMAGKATGKSGMAESRSGEDLGSKFKDTSAGGKGFETEGIADLGTKGRSSGNADYGDAGQGTKDTLSLKVGGLGEEFLGSIDKEAVKRVVTAGMREIRSCYERQLNKNKGLEGRIVLQWTIISGGEVSGAKVKTSNLNNKELEECMIARLKTWRFPEPPAGTQGEVQFPFVLTSEKE